MPAVPRGRIPSAVSRCTCAVVMANSRSGAGPDSLLLPPKIESRKPKRLGRGGGALELGLELRQALDALLHRRVGGEQRLQAALHAGRDDEEGVHPLRL